MTNYWIHCHNFRMTGPRPSLNGVDDEFDVIIGLLLYGCGTYCKVSPIIFALPIIARRAYIFIQNLPIGVGCRKPDRVVTIRIVSRISSGLGFRSVVSACATSKFISAVLFRHFGHGPHRRRSKLSLSGHWQSQGSSNDLMCLHLRAYFRTGILY